MLNGADPGPRGSLREYMLLKTQRRREEIEHLKFLLHLKVAQLDRSKADEILQFNKLLEQYFSLIDPVRSSKTPKSAKEQLAVLEDFSKEFKHNFKVGKLKNFQKADKWPITPSSIK